MGFSDAFRNRWPTACTAGPGIFATSLANQQPCGCMQFSEVGRLASEVHWAGDMRKKLAARTRAAAKQRKANQRATQGVPARRPNGGGGKGCRPGGLLLEADELGHLGLLMGKSALDPGSILGLF